MANNLPPEVREALDTIWSVTSVGEIVRAYCERVTADAARNALLAGRNGVACAAALDRAEKAEAERDALRKRIVDAPRVEMPSETSFVNRAARRTVSIAPGTQCALVALGDDDG